MAAEIDSVNGTRKAAILLASLGADVSAKIFKSLSEEEIEILSTEISRLPNVDDAATSAVTKEFLQMALTKQYITQGGVNYALDILDKAVGRTRAVEIMGRIQATIAADPLRRGEEGRSEPAREHPPARASADGRAHPREPRARGGRRHHHGAARRHRGPRSSCAWRRWTRRARRSSSRSSRCSRSQVSAGFTSGVSFGGGSKTVAEMLNRVDPATQKELLEPARRELPRARRADPRADVHVRGPRQRGRPGPAAAHPGSGAEGSRARAEGRGRGDRGQDLQEHVRAHRRPSSSRRWSTSARCA